MHYLTLKEAGAIIGRSERAMRSLIHRGGFPYSKIAGRRMISQTELEKYLKAAERVTATQALRRVGA